jgi:MFS transporter, DHA2 family, multidrug resistance protein
MMSADSSPAAQDGLARRPLFFAVAAVAAGTAMAVMDGAITNVALPIIARDLNAAPTEAIWVLNAYQLTVLMALLPLSALGDSRGHKRVYLWGMAVFVLASLACTLADSLLTLALARAVQGIGGASLMSVSMALVRSIYPQKLIGRGVGINSMVVAISAAAGPALGGAILTNLSWPWIFAINLPLGLAAIALAWRVLPKGHATRTPFDWASAGLSVVTLALFMGAAESIGHGAALWQIALLAAGAAFVGYVLVRRQAGQAHPLLPVDLLRRPIVALSITASICCFVSQMLVMVSLPFLLHDRMGMSAAEVGALFTPWPLALGAMAPVAGWLADRYPAGLLGGIGLAIAAIGMGCLSLLPLDAQPIDVVWRVSLCGIGFGLFLSPNVRTVISNTPRHRSGGAGGLVSLARLSGQTLGAVLAGLMLSLWPLNGELRGIAVAAGVALVAGAISLLRLRETASAAP